jgi:hypothetical protein
MRALRFETFGDPSVPELAQVTTHAVDEKPFLAGPAARSPWFQPKAPTHD